MSDIAGWIDDIIKNKVINITINITRKITDVVNTAKNAGTKGTPENATMSGLVEAGQESSNPLVKIASWAAGKIFGIDAEGDYNIPKGEMFIAQESGAELIGEINGKTSVANQQQIMEGISMGVERANAEQNALLRQQNDLLRGILEKETVFRFGASSAFGRVAQQSLDMYANTVGGR